MYCNIASILYFGFYGHKACGILAFQPGIEPAPSTLEALTTRKPEKSRPPLPPPALFLNSFFTVYKLLFIITGLCSSLFS